LTGPDGSSFGDALAWLDRHINLEAIEAGTAGRAALPTLERITALVSAMGDPQKSCPLLHVTGTNGKGSTTRLAAALLRAQGLSVGTITSPHLEAINERITYNDRPITDEQLTEILRALETLERFLLDRDSAFVPPTWFELVTAAGFRYFADEAVDAGVVEVGLGGRFDATNVGDGVVAAVTNVSLDHVDILGPTTTHIAAEKAGIIKPGAIAVIGEEDEELVGIFAAEATRVGAAALWRRGPDFACLANSVAHGGRLLDLRTPGATYDEVYLSLHGAHQGLNASVALAAVEAFFGAPLAEDVVATAFATAAVPGRLEVVGRHPLVVLDGAHNAAGASVLGAALRDDFAGTGRILLVMGCLRGRDPSELLTAITAAVGASRISHVVACAPSSPRAQPAENVAAAAADLGLSSHLAEDVAEALALGRHLAAEDDVVAVTGSLYVVGSARAAIGH
jgi:dihydrofolate synthase/folylpolyglutamate synthase